MVFIDENKEFYFDIFIKLGKLPGVIAEKLFIFLNKCQMIIKYEGQCTTDLDLMVPGYVGSVFD